MSGRFGFWVAAVAAALIYLVPWGLALKEPLRWEPISAWKGAKPKGLADFFYKYRLHILEALQGEERKAAALAKAGAASRAVLENVGREPPKRAA